LTSFGTPTFIDWDIDWDFLSVATTVGRLGECIAARPARRGSPSSRRAG
jgi:hypothetical protein